MDYLYEKDMKGRTPLIYACAYDREDIISYFLQLGCNVDKTCNKNKTSLFYALQNENIHITQLLLHYGASPWSSIDCPYSRMIRKMGTNQLETLFSNAKKIHIAVRLHVGSQKRT